MKTSLIVASSLLTFAATIPYLVEIIRGLTWPRLVTWFTWSLILAVGAAAALSEHQIPAAVLMASTSFEAALVVVFGFKKGDRTLEKLDIACLAGVLVGLVLWVMLKSPEAAVAVTVLIDFIGIIPTLKHAWLKPHEETLITYVLFTASNILILIVANFHEFCGIAYPIYVFFADLSIAVLLLASPHHIKKLAKSKKLTVDVAESS